LDMCFRSLVEIVIVYFFICFCCCLFFCSFMLFLAFCLSSFLVFESTLLMLVSAFAGYEHIMKAYSHAIDQSYRFFSYGDAMFLG